MSDRQQIVHAAPAWIAQVVGLLEPSLAIPVLHLPPLHGLMFFAPAVASLFAIPLFMPIFSRLLFEPPMPEALRPSLLILVAPFVVGCSAIGSAWGNPTHSTNHFIC